MIAVPEDKETMMAVPEDKEKMVAVPEDSKKTKRRKRSKLCIESVPSCDVFDVICNGVNSRPCPRLVTLYARLGLHRYNLLQGKNLQLSSVNKYNQSTHSAACSYDITLEAMNDLALLPFQTKVYEVTYGKLALWCSIARPLGETTIIDQTKKRPISGLYKNFTLMDTMPEWPPEDPFEHSERYYVLNKSELQHYDWIRLYLELAVATTNRGTIRHHDLSNLKIVKVAKDTDTTTPQHLDLVFNCKKVAIFYIMYKDSCEARVGKDVDRVAIVRRAFYERWGCFGLVGRTLSLEELCQKKG